MGRISTEFLEKIDRKAKKLAPQFQAVAKSSTEAKDTGTLKASVRVRLFRRSLERWNFGLYQERYGYILNNQAQNKKYKSSRSVPLSDDSKLVRDKKKYTKAVEKFLDLKETLATQIETSMASDIEDILVRETQNALRNG